MKIDFNPRESMDVVISLIAGVFFAIFFYYLLTPSDIVGFLTYSTVFVLLPIWIIYMILSEIRKLTTGFNFGKIKKIKIVDDQKEKEEEKKE